MWSPERAGWMCAQLSARVRRAHGDSGDERYRRVEGMMSQWAKSGRDSIVTVIERTCMIRRDLEHRW
jgi:hypothetical protein